MYRRRTSLARGGADLSLGCSRLSDGGDVLAAHCLSPKTHRVDGGSCTFLVGERDSPRNVSRSIGLAAFVGRLTVLDCQFRSRYTGHAPGPFNPSLIAAIRTGPAPFRRSLQAEILQSDVDQSAGDTAALSDLTDYCLRGSLPTRHDCDETLRQIGNILARGWNTDSPDRLGAAGTVCWIGAMMRRVRAYIVGSPAIFSRRYQTKAEVSGNLHPDCCDRKGCSWVGICQPKLRKTLSLRAGATQLPEPVLLNGPVVQSTPDLGFPS